MEPLRWSWLGRRPHSEVIARQEAMRDRLLAGDPSATGLLLCEHDPVITLGRSADRGHVLAAGAVPVVETRRGGDVTYHGPGQLMVYPVVRVRGVVAYLSAIAGALAEVAGELGAPGAVWRRDPAGLWLGDDKLAACGIHLRRGVAIHGFALDVSTPPEAWRAIVPCGLAGARVTSIERASGRPAPPVAEVARRIGPAVCRALGYSPSEERASMRA